MLNERAILLDDFESKHFSFKKESLLLMLRELSGTSELVNDLGVLVYNINEPIKEYVFIKIYNFLLDAIYYARERKTFQAVEVLGNAKNTLKDIRKEEEEEKRREEADGILFDL